MIFFLHSENILVLVSVTLICKSCFWQNCGANGQRSDTSAVMSVLISVLTELRPFLKGLDEQSYMDKH